MNFRPQNQRAGKSEASQLAGKPVTHNFGGCFVSMMDYFGVEWPIVRGCFASMAHDFGPLRVVDGVATKL